MKKMFRENRSILLNKIDIKFQLAGVLPQNPKTPPDLIKNYLKMQSYLLASQSVEAIVADVCRKQWEKAVLSEKLLPYTVHTIRD